MNLTTRKTTFKQDILGHVHHIPGGSKAYRAYLERTALVIVNDLARLGALPFKLKLLTSEKISKLVYLWKSEKLSPKTIANRLAVLRAFAKTDKELPYSVPNNQTFNLKFKQNIKTLTNTTLTLNPYDIVNPDIQRICLLQYLFGLAKFEAIRCFELLSTPEALIVPRKISFNKLERKITIETKEQKKLLNNLRSHPLTDSTKLLSLLHIDTLKKANINEKEYFRLFYIVNRYKQLRSFGASKREALKQVKQETGFTSLRQIKGVLSCLEDF